MANIPQKQVSQACEPLDIAGEKVWPLLDEETGEVLYRPFRACIFTEDHKSLVGYEEEIMVPVYPDQTPSGRRLIRAGDRSAIEHGDREQDWVLCTGGYYRRRHSVTEPDPRELQHPPVAI